MISSAVFWRKASNLKELKKVTKEYSHEQAEFVIVNYVELNDKEFNEFCNDFLNPYEFIVQNDGRMTFENDKYYCILVYNKNSNDGILVENEGYHYARYTGLVDMSKMNEVENGNRK